MRNHIHCENCGRIPKAIYREYPSPTIYHCRKCRTLHIVSSYDFDSSYRIIRRNTVTNETEMVAMEKYIGVQR